MPRRVLADHSPHDGCCSEEGGDDYPAYYLNRDVTPEALRRSRRRVRRSLKVKAQRWSRRVRKVATSELWISKLLLEDGCQSVHRRARSALYSYLAIGHRSVAKADADRDIEGDVSGEAGPSAEHRRVLERNVIDQVVDSIAPNRTRLLLDLNPSPTEPVNLILEKGEERDDDVPTLWLLECHVALVRARYGHGSKISHDPAKRSGCRTCVPTRPAGPGWPPRTAASPRGHRRVHRGRRSGRCRRSRRTGAGTPGRCPSPASARSCRW